MTNSCLNHVDLSYSFTIQPILSRGIALSHSSVRLIWNKNPQFQNHISDGKIDLCAVM